MPDHGDEIRNREFKIDEILPEKEIVLLTVDGKNVALDVWAEDVDPESELAHQIRQLPDYDHVTCSLEFHRDEPGVIGGWEFQEIHSMRRNEGAERNIFEME